MTDQERIETVKKILDILHDPKTGLNARRKELRQKYKDNKEYEQAKYALLSTVAQESANKRKISSDDIDDNDMNFMLTGEDVVEKYFVNSCGQYAKAFCYIHDKLVEKKEIEPLDLQIMVSTNINYLSTAQHGHTLPCVKMGDGKWYAIEPNQNTKENYPTNPQYGELPLIFGEIKVGNKINHILKGVDDPYKIMAIMPWKEYEEKLSDFANFLKVSTEWDKNTKIMLSAILNVQKEINLNDGLRAQICAFCYAIKDTKMPIRVVMANRKNSAAPFFTLTIKIGTDLCYFMPRHHHYVFLNKLKDLGDNKFLDIGSKDQYEYTMVKEFTPSEYIKYFESDILTQTQERQ